MMPDVQKYRVTTRLEIRFVCSRYRKMMKGKVNLIKKLGDEETENGYCYLENRLNASDGCEATVTARVRCYLEEDFL